MLVRVMYFWRTKRLNCDLFEKYIRQALLLIDDFSRTVRVEGKYAFLIIKYNYDVSLLHLGYYSINPETSEKPM